MRRLSIKSLVGLVLWVAACPCALAAEDQPQTGTIEVEVVYKDTGEPVEGVFVDVAGPDLPAGSFGNTTGYTSEKGTFIARDQPPGSHEVRISNRWVDARGELGSSRFLYDSSEAVKGVAVTGEAPVARVKFTVERGAVLSGVVRRQDGSLLNRGTVSIFQGESNLEEAFSRIDDHGRFEAWGVVPAPSVGVTVFTEVPGPDGKDVGMPVVAEKAVELSGGSTFVELEVETASVELVLEIERRVWPFRLPSEEVLPYIDGWIIDADVPDATEPDPGLVDIFLVFTDVARTSRARVPFGIPRDTYRFVLRDLPVGKKITFGMEDEDEEMIGPLKSVTTGKTTPTVTFRMSVPGARRSRAFLYGVLSVLVMAVLLTILVRGARKRRRASD